MRVLRFKLETAVSKVIYEGQMEAIWPSRKVPNQKGMIMPSKLRLAMLLAILTVTPAAIAQEIAGDNSKTTQALQAAENRRLAMRFIQRIQLQVFHAWRGNFPGSLHCEIAITLSPIGDLIGQPRVVFGSGNHAFDQAVLRAIETATPFPPPAGLPYHIFKEVVIRFNAKLLNKQNHVYSPTWGSSGSTRNHDDPKIPDENIKPKFGIILGDAIRGFFRK